ncbi:2-C-methyl-D-erythritol 2,4-cyclodiphosphate synthase [Rickettsiella endosymbiont of Dermanyssus gallinae]|uniref:2-C-methyl-D-erythritol 2,4-cyclodiphosphate synthase n=1 Tax=Rickettsiella endosymbiont of Dermanyssus gallinae TaxID=2856608 RepID=UPI001C529446|nr:2-C-methyl-D-erythritol 2,4-cyclodiphosphate synthase [Rickettsiella endosymbiont of Dermanyssus gallinae]
MTNDSNLRIGYGVDVHAFASGDHITLGGVTIPYHVGLRAHSDGDVVIHALVDALLGACALGDIGQHFPDTESRWKGCSSRIFLKESVRMLQERNFSIANVDITVLAEAPKLSQYREAIRANLADDMSIALNQVNIKATTTEKLGFIGRKEGIAATAIVLIQKQANN